MAERRSIIVISAVALAVIAAGVVIWFLSRPASVDQEELVVDETTPTPVMDIPSPEPTDVPSELPVPTPTPTATSVAMTAQTGSPASFILLPAVLIAVGAFGLRKLAA